MLYAKKRIARDIHSKLEYINTFIKGSNRDALFEGFFDDLRSILSDAWLEAAQEIISRISKLDRVNREKIIRIVDDTFLQAGNDKYAMALNLGFITYRKSIQMHLKTFRFNEFDRELSDGVTYEPFVWFHRYYDTKVRVAMLKAIKESTLQREGIAGLQKRLQDLFTNYDLPPIRMHPETYWELVARNTTTRLRNVAGAATMIRMGVTAYRIVAVLDKRTTPFCQAMNGKIIPISTAYDWLNEWMSMDSPTQIKSKLPFPNPNDPSPIQGLSGSEIPAVYALPPYHHFCRTTYVTVDRPLKIEYSLKAIKRPLEEEIISLAYLVNVGRLSMKMAEKTLRSHPLFRRENESGKRNALKLLKGGLRM
ncbi:hypothetical protein [Mesoaciditoga lauensis]|uniref:hypothetical protein n=1 Tax=Mesoaciditoga lauensis TaxID=1495039 RepID=UPI00055D8704|nr:hypothetical protein [Mesoaciditoga lauensis]